MAKQDKMAAPKANYYEILGVNHSATLAEIRRAYRILARRYHPDLNPGKTSEERFKIIALAYQTLNDPEKKRNYDADIDSARRIKAGFAAYEKAQNFGSKGPKKSPGSQASFKAQQSQPKSPADLYSKKESTTLSGLLNGINKLISFWPKSTRSKPNSKVEIQTSTVSVIEVSVSMQDAIFGGRKAIEVPSSQKDKKISLRIPAGVRNGSVLRMRSGTLSQEDYVIILRVAPHPFIELAAKGLIVELPISIEEALFGATIKVPGLEEEESITIPAGSQSGQEVRVTAKGVKFDDGRRGDLFYRLNIQIPTSYQAVGIKEKAVALSEYYETQIRQDLPKKLRS